MFSRNKKDKNKIDRLPFLLFDTMKAQLTHDNTCTHLNIEQKHDLYVGIFKECDHLWLMTDGGDSRDMERDRFPRILSSS